MRSSNPRFLLPFVPFAIILMVFMAGVLRAVGCIHYDAPVIPDGLGLPPAVVVLASIRD